MRQVRLNDPGEQNGLVKVKVDGELAMQYKKVFYRNSTGEEGGTFMQ